VTLYHWDLPQALEETGGWPRRSTVDAYAAYVETVAARLGDRVRHWITQCEPWVISWLGYATGEHAPGRTSDADALAAMHHVLLAHGRALSVLRSVCPAAEVGISVDLVQFEPGSDDPLDAAAADEAHAIRNRAILDPLLTGEYPLALVARYADILPRIEDGDMRAIHAPLDFLGVNYYTRNVVRADARDGAAVAIPVDGAELTEMGWEVYPAGLFALLVRLRDEYDVPPLYITENGAAFPDSLQQGRVVDGARISYLGRHLGALSDAIAEGVDVRGYFVWSLLDNFEWALGYSRRFGLVYVDYASSERIPKASFRWYRDLIAAHRAATSFQTRRP
jgi:beta-glucosidase